MPTFYDTLYVTAAEQRSVISSSARFQTILRAVNDHAITRLLVPDGEPGRPEFGRATLASGRLRTTLAYAPDGHVRAADLRAVGNAIGESYVSAVLEHSSELDTGARTAISATRAHLLEDGRPVERYRRISLEDARAMLAPPVEAELSAAQ